MLGGSDLTTTIGRATGAAGFDDSGNPLYRNRNMESASEKAKRKANRDIREMADRLSADQSIIVIQIILNKKSFHPNNFLLFSSHRIQRSIYFTRFTRIK